MKLKLFLQILILSSFSYILQAAVPTANSQSLSSLQHTATSITLTGNHNGGTGSFTFAISGYPNTAHGTLSGLNTSTGAVTYTSNVGFAGQDTFTFTVTDTAGTSTAATVYINVLQVSTRAYVTNEGAGGSSIVNIIDVILGTSAGTVSGSPTAFAASEIVITPDGNKAYICYGDQGIVSVIDTNTNVTLPAVTGNIRNPYAMAISPDGSKGYICNFTNNTIAILDPTNDSAASNVLDPHSYLNTPFAIAFTPDGSRAYAGNFYGANFNVVMIDVVLNTITTLITGSSSTGFLVEDIVISPDGNFGYVVYKNSGSSSGVVLILDTNPNSGTYNTFVGTIDATSYPLNIPIAMIITPNGLKGYIINAVSSGFVSVVDLNPSAGTYHQVTANVSGTFNIPEGIACTADGTQAYVADYGDNLVPIITVSSDTATSSISGYQNPNRVAFLGDPKPTANSQSLSSLQHTATSITLTGNHNGGTGSFTFAISGYPNTAHGILSGLNTSTGAVTYTSNVGFAGQDTFTFTVTDTAGTSTAATVYINVLPPSARAYVTDSDVNSNNTISPIDVLTGTKGTDFDVVSFGLLYFLQATPDATKAYLGYSNDVIQVIDTLTNTVLSNVIDNYGNIHAPNAMAISPDGSKAYICNQQGFGTISILDIGTNQVAQNNVSDPLSSIYNPSAIAFSPNGLKAYVLNTGSPGSLVAGSISIIDVQTDTITAKIVNPTVSDQLSDLVISPNGKFAYVVIQNNGTGGSVGRVRILNLTTNVFSGTINDAAARFNAPFQMAITPSGTKAYVVNPVSGGSGFVSVVNLNPSTGAGSVSANVSGSFNSPVVAAFTSDGSQAYVLNFAPGLSNSSVQVVDSSNTVVSSITGYTTVAHLAFLGFSAPVATTTALGALSTGGAQNYTLGASGGSGTYTTYTLSGQTSAHGTISQPSGTGSSALRYTPSGTVGTDQFYYTVTDSFGVQSASQLVIITVENVIANSQTVGVLENSSGNLITVTGSGGTAPYTFTQVTPPSDALSYSFNTTTGVLTYTPNTGFIGTDNGFTFNVTDNLGVSSTVAATVSIMVDVAPVATTTALGALSTGGAQNYTLGASGGSGTYTTYTLSGQTSAHGTISQPSGTGSNVLRYTPSGTVGTDQFYYTVTDSLGVTSASQLVTITVENVIANPQSVGVIENTPTLITLSATGGTPPYTFINSSAPANGGLSGLPNTTGLVTYTPNLNYTGPDVFLFKVTDSFGVNSLGANITISVTADTPIAISRTVSSVAQGSSNNPITLTGSDPGGETLSFALVSGTTAHGGTITQSVPGSANVLYTPNPSFSGSDTFTFTVTNSPSGITSSPGTITIPVVAGDIPVANDQTAYTYLGVQIGINIYGSDPGGLPITFVLNTLPSFGTIQGLVVSGADSAVVNYMPQTGYYGSDSFTFHVTNGTNPSSVATVTITITDINLPSYVDSMVSKYYQLVTEQ